VAICGGIQSLEAAVPNRKYEVILGQARVDASPNSRCGNSDVFRSFAMYVAARNIAKPRNLKLSHNLLKKLLKGLMSFRTTGTAVRGYIA
jgi:hypothetical protein